ncbi:flavin reductase family protein [Thetidibacter halocola]|uniref:Flavin reductase family protein n=1 Tax=Thetidibacter halocola TaxID=2827239 RepID=A0A8J7WF21_9RHOB|nr:flavin reductase family protein [Thetidibacter halocola]MBS0125607.1 flavin reductase family protein [Thetidibacter halocola]
MNAPMTNRSHSFDPATGDPRAFRDALGQFGTGVTVVTCETGTGPIGITANSFASVSLDPPLVLWSPAKSSSRYPFFMAVPHFAIHVVGTDQVALCSGFARTGDAFDGLDWERGARGVPLLNGCLARFECTTEAVHDAGDHSIIVARVTRVTTRPGAPLLFHGGRYGGFTEAS